MIDVLDHVLERTRVEVNRTQALITVAHVYAGEFKVPIRAIRKAST